MKKTTKKRNYFAKVTMITCTIFAISFFTWFNFAKPENRVANAVGGNYNVVNCQDLQTVLSQAVSGDTVNITVTASFAITSACASSATVGVNIASGVTVDIASGAGGPFTISRDASFAGDMISDWGTLTIANLIIDGGGSTIVNVNGDLISDYGTLTMNTGTILQNNIRATGYPAGLYVYNGGVATMDGDATIEGNSSTSNAAGVLVANGMLIMKDNSTVTNNVAGGQGAGIYVSGTGNSTLTMNGGVVANNTTTGTGTAGEGGGIYLSNGTATAHATANIANAQITGNTATIVGAFGGGGIWIGTNAVVNISDSTISGNTGGYGGGIRSIMLNPSITIQDTTFSDNIAASFGGGLYVGNSGTVTVTGSKFANNQALTGGTSGGGGAIYTDNANPTIAGTTFANNSTGGNGGAVMFGADTQNLAITGSVFVNNIAGGNGGAIGFRFSGVDETYLPVLTVDAATVFSGNSAAKTSRINPTDQTMYNTNILATQFSLPAPFNGYNNYDIQYVGTLPTDTCQYDSSLWKDDTNCVKPTEPETPTPPVIPSAPNTGFRESSRES